MEKGGDVMRCSHTGACRLFLCLTPDEVGAEEPNVYNYA